MKIRQILLVISLISIMIFSVGCGGPEHEAEKTVSKGFDALTSGDYLSAAEYMNLDQIISEGEIGDVTGISQDNLKEICDAFFKNFKYEIISSELKDDGSVIVKAKVSNLRMDKVAKKWFKELVSINRKYLDKGGIEENKSKIYKEMINKLKNEIKQEEKKNDVVEKTISIPVVKSDNEWKIYANDTVADAILGGFITEVEERVN